ncbi:MAG TPA: MFS transporter [bacterium]|nr:MFS transporter [bacterium]
MAKEWSTGGFGALCLGQFLAHQTSLTFSVLIPLLATEWGLRASQAGLILGGFQLGTLGAYLIVGFLLDRVRSRPIMAWSAFLVGAGDLFFAAAARDFTSGFALRLLVGVVIGGLYLPALKHIADTIPPWRRGAATGIYVAVIVAAYAAPLFYVGLLAPRVGWRPTMVGVGVLEMAGAVVLALKVPSIPAPVRVPTGAGRYLTDVLRNDRARRTIVAYTGHNWELFGMWGWLAPFMVAALTTRGVSSEAAIAWGGLLAAGAIGLGGGVGAVFGGRISDRLGRARAAMMILALSLACSLGFGWLLRAPIVLLVAAGLLYGTVALADSPAYSANLMEVVPPQSLGGAFSFQMLTGWAATAVAPAAFGMMLDLLAPAGPLAQWGSAFGLMAIGPLVGMIALAPLRMKTG